MDYESFFIFAAVASFSLIRRSICEGKNARLIGQPNTSTTFVSKADAIEDFDILIVGAGPSGSTAAFYAAKNHGLKVALCDKKSFPRYKPCGDAWCKPALDLLEDMGILKQMEQDGIVHQVRRGGLISPFGYSCINTDGSAYGSVNGCKTYAIKREIADEYLVRAAAKQPSCQLFEGMEITGASFCDDVDKSDVGYWKVTAKTVLSGVETEIIRKCKILLICDGSTSYLAQKLGIVPSGAQAEAVCSTAYAKAGTHKWNDADGVLIYNPSVLPGYSALFRHYNGDVFLGTYILPGGTATSRSIPGFEADAIERHPYIRAALGDKCEWVKKRVVAPIRLGGVPRPFGRQLLILGDAAGYVDPMTGEGIHTAMQSGVIAAQCVGEMFQTDDFSLAACRAYQLRCHDKFAYEFSSSSVAARLVYYFPILIDAVTCVGQRRGQAFLDFFGEVMTGVKPKSAFLQLGLIMDLSVEVVKQIIIQYVLRRPPLSPQDIGRKS